MAAESILRRKNKSGHVSMLIGGFGFTAAGIEREPASSEMGYQHTLMYGRYTKDLSDYAREEAVRQRTPDASKKEAAKKFGQIQNDQQLPQKPSSSPTNAGFQPSYKGKSAKDKCQAKCMDILSASWRYTFARIGEDWVFLCLLGIIMALLSFVLDYAIAMCQKARLWLYRDLASHEVAQYFAWVSLPVALILFSSGFTHIVAPQAIGSGIPEMKTILRGVVLKEYLTFRTLISKVIGLATALGSGMPLGKEGPFVHISSVVAALLSKLFTTFRGIYENESRSHEMLSAACAVGVACSFASPVGGVLFSIEATSVYFAVRNYWRGFFAAVAGSMVFRLLAVWFTEEETITALFKTTFRLEVPFDPQELFAFSVIGVISGFAGALFVWMHRKYVIWMRKNKRINYFLQKNRFIYPGVLTLFIASVQFPPGLGQFMAAELTNHEQVTEMFSNFSWSVGQHDYEQEEIISHWATPNSNVFLTLTVYVVITFLTTMLASTLPVASGIFIPHFKMGAAFGRLVGECMAYSFPDGLRFGAAHHNIIPGGYAVAGAAAWSGAVTHTISTSLIVLELTGQINHILPVMISVLISNAVAHAFQPSIYDSIIRIKRLPYLPDIISAASDAYNIYVEDMMVRDVKYIWLGATYRDVKNVLETEKRLRTFPLVDSPDSMILLGSVQRVELFSLLAKHLGRERRLHVAARRAAKYNQEMLPLNHVTSPDQLLLTSSDNVPCIVQTDDEDGEQPPMDEYNLTERRPSRFEVSKVDGNGADAGVPRGEGGGGDAGSSSPQLSPNYLRPPNLQFPKKSILKKTHAFSYYSPVGTPVVTPYSTVTSQDSRLRLALDSIFKKPPTDADDKQIDEAQLSTITKKVTLPKERIIDMSPEEQLSWEEEELDAVVNFEKCRIDPAPFQLVERTSLLKVHSLFSLLGLNHAYVTAIGRLVGVVALKEVRQAIEGDSGAPAAKAETTQSDSKEGGEYVATDPSDAHYISTVASINSIMSTATTDSDGGNSRDQIVMQQHVSRL